MDTSADERHPSDSDADCSDWVLVTLPPNSSPDHAPPPPSTDGESTDSEADVSIDENDPWIVAFNARVARALIEFAPQPTLPQSQLYNGKNRPPLWRFGYAFELDVAFEYAVRHKLRMLPGIDKAAEVPTFEEVLAQEGRSAGGMTATALVIMAKHLSKKCGFFLETTRTLSVGRELKFVAYLWSNYDYNERIRLCRNYDLVLHILDKAFKPFPGAVAEPFWYIDVDNDCLLASSLPSTDSGSTDSESTDSETDTPKEPDPWLEAFNARVARALIKFAPQPTLPQSQLYNGKNRPPLWRFGYAFDLDVAFEYAVRHKLRMLPGIDKAAEVPTFEEVLAQEGKMASGMTMTALEIMAEDLSDKCDFLLDTSRTLSMGPELKFVAYLWSNYDYNVRIKLCRNYDLVLHILDKAFKPFPGAVAEPFWYIDVDNDCLEI
ncbi:uncharacterized protein BXZ73DRAFT_106746 [Epithele typhae]|uniref:uncharacterized protein n=1 Tax=Epithele typhae TaxID=378194 RepID=UPI002008CBF6|nr:uncharacterized protein BXZ73DRAFT_106746 [Epithele typhae]KAH9913960.1 hypothetical protein BXZ73DRAFT_106746 [Epithele typhae]